MNIKVLLLCLCLLLTGCTQKPEAPVEKFSKTVFAMDTVMDLSAYAPDAAILDEAEQLIKRLEQQLSTTDTDSEIYAINQNGTGTLSADASELLNRALGFCEKTGGALDLSIYPVVRAWGFTTDSYQIPSQETLDSLLSYVDHSKIRQDGQTVTLPEHMEIDLGSVAKGYTSDRVVELFRENGISSALLNLGGNVQALGKKPDGSPWRIGIQDPLSDGYLGVLAMSDQAVITSGGYERYFTGDDGTVYWHIIDPTTGKPARTGLLSATAVGPEGVYCDALSTSLFIMGPEKAQDFWREYGDFEMILVTEAMEVLVTPGLDFHLNEGSPYEMQVISQ